jgi:hypothetical protein
MDSGAVEELSQKPQFLDGDRPDESGSLAHGAVGGMYLSDE